MLQRLKGLIGTGLSSCQGLIFAWAIYQSCIDKQIESALKYALSKDLKFHHQDSCVNCDILHPTFLRAHYLPELMPVTTRKRGKTATERQSESPKRTKLSSSSSELRSYSHVTSFSNTGRLLTLHGSLAEVKHGESLVLEGTPVQVSIQSDGFLTLVTKPENTSDEYVQYTDAVANLANELKHRRLDIEVIAFTIF